MTRLKNKSTAILATATVIMLMLSSISPAQSDITFGKWRDINPTHYSTNVRGPLRGIYVRNGGFGSIGAGDGWAVGGNSSTSLAPLVVRYDGFSWVMQTFPAGLYNSVNFCTNPGAPGVGLCSANGDGSDGWFVGSNTAGTLGISVYYDGSAATQISLGLSNSVNLTSVFMVCHSPQFGSGCPGGISYPSGLTYAVGKNSTAGAIWQFSGNPKGGAGWTEQTVTGTTTTQYNSVYMFQDGSGNLEGFAAGNGGVVARLNGGTWTATKINPSANDLLGVFVDQGNPIHAWAVGRGGQIWQFTTGSWAGTVSSSPTTNDLTGIFLTSTSEGWIVGVQSTILHSTTLGSSNVWTSLNTPLYTGTGLGTDLLGLSFPSSGNGWAVGKQGIIIQTSNSNCGSIVPAPCWGGSASIVLSPQLNSVFEVGQNDAWAGGNYSTADNRISLVHWDGVKWHRATTAPASVTTADILGIFMLGSSEGWALGGNPTTPEALKWDGNRWNGQPITGCGGVLPCEPTSVFMISSGTGGDGWAVGTGGHIWRYQSGAWTSVASPTTKDLTSVFINNPGSSTGAGWAVGKGGTVLKLTITGGIPTWALNNIPVIILGQDLYGVYFKDSTHGFIVGAQATVAITTDGVNWAGGASQVTPNTAVLRSVFIDTFGTGSGNGDGWAVGDDGTGPPANVVFAHWNGGGWTNIPLGDPNPPLAVSPTGLRLRSVYLTGPEDGFAVGDPIYDSFNGPVTSTLAGIIHLDPLNPPVVGQQTTTENSLTQTSTGSTIVSTSSSSSTSSLASTVTATSATTETSTSVSTSIVSTTAVVTETVTTSSSTTTPLVLPGIPGFPWESIIAGIIIGIALLGVARRKRRKSN